MAVGRVELEMTEFEGLLARLDDVRKGHPLWRCKRELKRGLVRAQELDAIDKANIAQLRRNRERHIPGPDEEPLIPHQMLRGRHR